MTSKGPFQVELFYDAVIQSAFQIPKPEATGEGLLGKANMCLGFLVGFFAC